MKFVNRNDFHMTKIDADEIVSTAVNDAGFDKHGALETLQAKVSELTIIVGMLVARLPSGDLVRFADEMAFSVVSEEEKL